MLEPVRLEDEQLARLADLVADRLAERLEPTLISAAELARRLHVSRDYVYAHRADLGAVRIGAGERPRLMFWWPLRPRETPQKAPEQVSRRKHRRTAGGREPVQLLEVKGGRP